MSEPKTIGKNYVEKLAHYLEDNKDSPLRKTLARFCTENGLSLEKGFLYLEYLIRQHRVNFTPEELQKLKLEYEKAVKTKPIHSELTAKEYFTNLGFTIGPRKKGYDFTIELEDCITTVEAKAYLRGLETYSRSEI
jgi:hypothetical protein